MSVTSAPHLAAFVDAGKSIDSRTDHRKGDDESRLVWNDGLSSENGKWFIHTRRQVQQAVVNDRVDAYPLYTPLSSLSKTPLAFEPRSTSYSTWSRVVDVQVQVLLDDLVVVETVGPELHRLGLPTWLGSNVLLRTLHGSKRLYLPSLTLIQAIAIPSSRMLLHLSHPLNIGHYLRQCPADGMHEVRSFTPSFAAVPFSGRDLVCMAYWLEDNRYLELSSMLCRYINAGAPLSAPKGPGKFVFDIQGYETDDAIVAQCIHNSAARTTWPGTWLDLLYIRARGGIACRMSRWHDGRAMKSGPTRRSPTSSWCFPKD